MTSLRFVRLFYNLTSYTWEARKGVSVKLMFISIKVFFSLDIVKLFIIIDSYTLWVLIVLFGSLYTETPLSFLIIPKTRNIFDTVIYGFYFIFYFRFFLKTFNQIFSYLSVNTWLKLTTFRKTGP